MQRKAYKEWPSGHYQKDSICQQWPHSGLWVTLCISDSAVWYPIASVGFLIASLISIPFNTREPEWETLGNSTLQNVSSIPFHFSSWPPICSQPHFFAPHSSSPLDGPVLGSFTAHQVTPVPFFLDELPFSFTQIVNPYLSAALFSAIPLVWDSHSLSLTFLAPISWRLL